jgi:hypothetical protein
MTLSEAIGELRRRNEQVPKPVRLPLLREVAEMQALLGVRFHPDYEQLLLQASDVVVGPLEPATITVPARHTHLPKVVASARKYGVPEELFPICEDNADFYCLAEDGRVVFWSHNGWAPSSWPDLASWIRDVWLADYE